MMLIGRMRAQATLDHLSPKLSQTQRTDRFLANINLDCLCIPDEM
jgi:hypothetical protein